MYCSKLNIYGIRIYNGDSVLFERKYDIIMNNDAMNEIKLFYEQLNEKKYVKIKIYTKCNGIDDYNDNFMIWWAISHEYFIKKFGVIN
jgi:hypothetical protein